MKKTLTTILMFAVVMAACLGIAELVEWLRPEREPEPEPVDEPVVVANVMDEAAATVITFGENGAEVFGIGATATEEGVKIVYPGTYRLSGTLAGQILVDCDEYHGGVYLMLDGVDVTCATGPAIHVKQSEKTVLYLVEGTVNTLRDGAGYVITETLEDSLGGAVYCDDDLYIEGDGALTVLGSNADGIRSKDGLTVSSGTITVDAADDALQGSDYVTVLGGTLALTAQGDGIASTKGDITLAGGAVTLAAQGDGVSSAANVYLQSGTLSAVTYGGAEYYETMAANGLSAKGVKGESIEVTGGVYTLNTADDALHGDLDLTVAGGEIAIRSGDDALSALRHLLISGGAVTVETGYEGLEAEYVAVAGGVVSITAENDGVDAIGGFDMTGGVMAVAAPQCISTEETILVQSGELMLAAGEDEPALKFREASVTGGTLIALGSGTTADFLSGGAVPGSFLFVLPGELAAGSAVGLWDASGNRLLSTVTAQPSSMILVASGAMGIGQEYTLTAGEWALTGVLGEENTVVR